MRTPLALTPGRMRRATESRASRIANEQRRELAYLAWRVSGGRRRTAPPLMADPRHPACRSLPDRMPPRPVGVDGPGEPMSQLEQIAWAAIEAELRRAARERAHDITGES